ncbi:hypothetical protein [Dysosmobacter sp.]|uniref:hypothetical protein n=1 Tax=Dysosmobacter sp. TaxID=2591382 RepID=UPI002A93C4A7|nr:hypothetical protein [Dysosmobacter sp.]MDY5509500.1 hypothetical protein [Dysosmobacter sp.]
MKTELLKIKGDWREVVDDCRSTVGKEELGHEPSQKFKREILIAEHSPIRDLIFKWRWPDMPHWVTVHWVRHKWEKFVRTQRSDRTGIPREKLPQDEPQTFTGEANTQHLIDTMRKRLCGQASPETRAYAEDLKQAIAEMEPEVAGVLVPNCVYRCGCPEKNCCGYWQRLKRRTNGDIVNEDIQERYDLYNAVFREDHPKEGTV